MNNKIPPPIVTLVSGLIIFFSRPLFPEYDSNLVNIFSTILLFLGLLVFFLAVVSFKKYKTTVNPLQPSNASHLVISGIFRFSRNPMYLGLVLLTIAATIFFGTWLGVVIVVIFIFLLNLVQIIPEEEALLDIFGEEYVEYQKKVRRWI